MCVCVWGGVGQRQRHTLVCVCVCVKDRDISCCVCVGGGVGCQGQRLTDTQKEAGKETKIEIQNNTGVHQTCTQTLPLSLSRRNER